MSGPRDRVGEVLKDAWTIAQKDLRVELRSREILLTMGYFGFLVVLVFAFSFPAGDVAVSAVAAGILWVSIAFAGTLGLSRVFEREREGDCMRALMLSPVSRPAIYLGKCLGVLVFMLSVEAVVLPAVAFFFNLPIDHRTPYLLATLLLGTIGYTIVGTLLSAMLVRARAKDVLLAIVLYPLILPVLIIGVKASTVLLEPRPDLVELAVWMRVLGMFDIVFLVVGLWVFEPLLMD